MTIKEAIELLDSDDIENLKYKYITEEIQEAIDIIIRYVKERLERYLKEE